MKYTINLCLIMFSLTMMGCSEDEETKTTVLTSSGKEISMDGIWQSDCIDFADFRLSEDFDFRGEQLLITIRQYNAETCENADATETVTITFQVLDLVEATLNGSVVTGNRVLGTQQSSNDREPSTFKQTFFIDDSDGTSILYHGVFEDDGGAISSDGYPLDLHPFAITQQ